jgi:hypothetical protein
VVEALEDDALVHEGRRTDGSARDAAGMERGIAVVDACERHAAAFAVGVAAGVYPALRAARTSPMDSLRTE